jgi:hypothetical protein
VYDAPVSVQERIEPEIESVGADILYTVCNENCNVTQNENNKIQHIRRGYYDTIIPKIFIQPVLNMKCNGTITKKLKFKSPQVFVSIVVEPQFHER